MTDTKLDTLHINEYRTNASDVENGDELELPEISTDEESADDGTADSEDGKNTKSKLLQ